ncbi:4-hydroxybenzoate polyprenyltransferase [Actinopolyspora xinjiangensis]|uniref:4-hydroxybenzoate polyprenyltransferase n=1 Tax=Actinopolyspora xinjiangensis TaxID=405564 RepID=A0A1H0RP90_9ACTN|nr:UbiA family prenyltransferase [Actinopolyspora xinjiangensis]SDP31351.1 4-hydroxybenzoate polyprenyltransferase [Actinopolyspora xinjiangensis]
MRIRTLLELVRAPAALSVPGDVAAGAVRRPSDRGTTAGLVLSSCCLYWAGMALNDYTDRLVDAVERPGRPIPSGRVPASSALALSISLTALATGIAALSGGKRTLVSGIPLAGTIWGYNLGLKNTPAGPATMATARALDVLHGAGPAGPRDAAPAAAVIGAHTFAVSTVGRDEVTGAPRRVPAIALAVTVAIVSTLLVRTRLMTGSGGSEPPPLPARGTTLAALTVYAGTVGTAQWRALREPSPARLRRATGDGILGMIPLQAALIAAGGAKHRAVTVLSAYPVARRLFGRVSPT